MPLQILPVTATDIPTLAHIHLNAFMLTRFTQALYPHGLTPPIIAATTSRHTKYFTTDPTVTYLKIIDTALYDRPIAFAEWHVFPTIAAEASRKDLGPMTWPEDANLPLAQQFWSQIIAARKTMQGTPHVFLSVIATEPGQGRRGAGSMLMQWGVEEADRRGLPCFLEASPHGKGLYEKFGFVEKEELGFSVDISPEREGSEMYKHWVMVRDIKTGEGG